MDSALRMLSLTNQQREQLLRMRDKIDHFLVLRAALFEKLGHKNGAPRSLGLHVVPSATDTTVSKLYIPATARQTNTFEGMRPRR